MATYACRLYQNTGFNAVNIPGTPTLLESCARFDVNAVEIMQNRFLQKIRVRATWDQVKNCDYIRLGTINPDYYFISSIAMLATDVAELSVLYDYVTTAGGPANLQILDGITSRVHVTDDSFGKYCEADPLTAPSQPLQVQMNWFNPSTESHTYVESTVNLPQTGAAQEGISYKVGGDESVIIPTVRHLERFTQYSLAGHDASVNPHTMLYDLNDTTPASMGNGWNNQKAILMGQKRVRELGIEQGAIINQVQIPVAYAEAASVDSEDVLVDSQYVDDEGHTVYHTQDVVDRSILTFRGKTGTQTSNMPYEYTGARNNRLNYGEYTKYGLISCSGESCEYNAEDIKDTAGPTSPILRYMGDPHTDGKPYFRWRMVNGDSSDIGFFKNCITGLQWKQIPLFFNDPSGTAINTLKYQNSRNIAATEFNNANIRRDIDTIKAVTSGAAGIISGGLTGDIGGAFGSFANASMTMIGNALDEDLSRSSYYAQKRSEMSDYMVQNTVAAPEINFPYNSEVMRDFFGNGCMMYRYKYTQADINRIDKLLTMYGYKHTKPLETSDFTNRVNFNYVECSNVTVTGLPKWMCDGVSMMLKNGVRVWHVLPNPALYNQNNPVR